jgi:hypothetical protein
MGNSLSSARVRYEPIRNLGFAAINAATFTAIGLPFANPVRILKITNLTDAPILISFNGIDSHDVVGANGFCLYDYSTNKADAAGFLEQAQGERVYAQAITALPTINGVYVTVIYAAMV